MDTPLTRSALADLDRLVSLVPDDRPVPTCPGWTMTDLLSHVSGFARWAAACLDAGSGPAEMPPPPDRPDDVDLTDWLAGSRAVLRESVAALDPATRDLSSFFGPRDASFWARRMAAELAIHRNDGDRGDGREPQPVDAVAAAAGIDEVVELAFDELFRTQLSGLETSLHLHATDEAPDGTPGEWFAEWAGGEFRHAHVHDKGALAIRASRSDLFLMLWGRPPVGDVQRFGDDGVLATIREIVAY